MLLTYKKMAEEERKKKKKKKKRWRRKTRDGRRRKKRWKPRINGKRGLRGAVTMVLYDLGSKLKAARVLFFSDIISLSCTLQIL